MSFQCNLSILPSFNLSKPLFMKRLLIATFLVICSITIFAIADQPARNNCEKKKVCCKKNRSVPSQDIKPDYIFWQPLNKLMFISN